MLVHDRTKLPEIQGGKSVVQRTDKIFVIPLCLFDLEKNSRCSNKLLVGKVYQEANANIIQPYVRNDISIRLVQLPCSLGRNERSYLTLYQGLLVFFHDDSCAAA